MTADQSASAESYILSVNSVDGKDEQGSAKLAIDRSSHERMSEVHAQLQDKFGTLDVARGTVDIPSMYE